MLARLRLDRSVYFAAGMLAGVVLAMLTQRYLSPWRVDKLHYQNGELSIHTLVRFNEFTGEVETLMTSEPSR